MLANKVSCYLFFALAVSAYALVPSRRRRDAILQRRERIETETETAAMASSTDDVSKLGNCHSVDGTGVFAVVKTYDFTSRQLPSDFQISNYSVTDSRTGDRWNHGFSSSNVFVSDGFLNLRVPGGQDSSQDSENAIWGGEVFTAEANILYGSIRTEAIFDGIPGTCQGIFSYHDDTNEIDIEYMSNVSSTANPSPFAPPVFWYTNQPGGESDTNQATGPASLDVTSEIHEYRIDWVADRTDFYIDGVLQKTLKGNVPQTGSQWVWNNWSNGNPDWSSGPPDDDSVFRIRSITMYYNTTDSATCEPVVDARM